MDEKTKRRIRDFSLGGSTRKSRIDETLVGVTSIAEAGLAIEEKGGLTNWLNHWLADNFNKNLDAYDSAIDAVYNQTHIGGSRYHHIVDGQHSIWGAFKAVQDVKADDTWLHEMTEAGEHLLRDATTISGISPFFQFTENQFNQISSLVESNLGISKIYLADALTINGVELLGGGIALATSVIMGKKADPSKISYLGGAYLTSAIASANPLLLPIAAGGLVYAAYKSEDKLAVLKEGGKGALTSGGVLLTSALVGGPVWLGLVAGIMTVVAINYTIRNPQKAWNKVQKCLAPARRIIRTVCDSPELDLVLLEGATGAI